MAIRYENQCVDCPPEIGCLGPHCPKREVEIYVCDRCGAEAEELFISDSYEDICWSCLQEKNDGD